MSSDSNHHMNELGISELGISELVGAKTTVTDNTVHEKGVERRSSNRTRDDVDWESKVIGRLHGRLRELALNNSANQSNLGADAGADPTAETQGIGWETTVLDVLRRRIERGPN